MLSKILFPERPFKTPLFYRLLEGLTSFSMLIGFLMGGGHPMSFLFFFYVLHSLASFCFHLFPSQLTYFLDVSMIDWITMERGYMKSHNLWLYAGYLALMFAENTKTHWGLMVRVVLMIIFTPIHNSVYYICMWLLVLLTFFQSCRYVLKKDAFRTTLTCCLYHLYLGVVSYMETIHYDWGYTMSRTEKFAKYCAYFLFISCVMTHLTKSPKRLRSILSFMTATILSPLSFLEIYMEISSGHHNDEIQFFMANFYMAYVVVDVLIGMLYYPEYLTFLEGWLHHFGTFLIVYYGYYINPMKRIRVCILLIVETPSIILFLSRIFYDVLWIKKLKKTIFYPSFFMFRIVAPIFLVLYLQLLSDVYDFLIIGSFTSLNFYWLVKICC